LAQFHSLDVPLAKDVNWLKRYFNEFYDKGYQEFPIDHIIKEVNAQNLIKRNLKEEYEWLLRCIDAMNSPIVFSHNDFRGSNLLVHEIVDDNNPRLITLCDFEYSCYYYRGFDLGVCLSEFGNTLLSAPQQIPSDKVLEEFLRGYLDESIKIHGEEYGLNDQNSMKQLINETKIFSLAGNMFIIMFLFHAKELPFNKNKNEIIVSLRECFKFD
jgi:ethanolamine kinase